MGDRTGGGQTADSSQLHPETPEKLELKVGPGTVVLFNGDKVWHAVTPIAERERRFIVSMQYVTNGEMSPFMRLVSNMKDSIAYLGLKKVFLGGRSRGRTEKSSTPHSNGQG